jgi:hypothetical protein
LATIPSYPFYWVLLLLPSLLPLAVDLPGDACLPKDVVNLLGGDLLLDTAKKCKSSVDECTPGCRAALYALKAARCYHALTQPQRQQPRQTQHIALPAMQGIWYGLYPANGVELLELTWDAPSETLSATKLTGNSFVRAGRVSWAATPSGCRVVSSLYAGAFAPRWDPCVLTMFGHDHMSVDLGAEGEGLAFVRAKTHLLFEWAEERSPAHGLAEAFTVCELDVQDAQASLTQWLSEQLHHSAEAVA